MALVVVQAAVAVEPTLEAAELAVLEPLGKDLLAAMVRTALMLAAVVALVL
jgi:hypothetical protein